MAVVMMVNTAVGMVMVVKMMIVVGDGGGSIGIAHISKRRSLVFVVVMTMDMVSMAMFSSLQASAISGCSNDATIVILKFIILGFRFPLSHPRAIARISDFDDFTGRTKWSLLVLDALSWAGWEWRGRSTSDAGHATA